MTAVAAFLRATRIRLVFGDVLAAAFASTVINEAGRWATIGVLVAMKRVAPALDVGPLILALLVFAAIRRWSPAAAARRADARLGLSDRLTSFLDFAARGDVPGEVREAQARETARSLDGVRPAQAAPIRGWLAVGPLLLLASLIYPSLLFTETRTTTSWMISRIGAGLDRDGGQGPAGRVPDDAPAPADGGKGGAAPQTAAPPQPEAPESTAAQTKPEPEQATASQPLDGPKGEGPLPAPQDEIEEKRPADQGQAVAPDQLVSERVGRALAKVVDPVYNPASEKPQPPEAAGSVSINLVPRSRAGRAGSGPGEGATAGRVTVDLDALPEEYRPLVKTYFELLAAGAPAAGGAPPPPARSETP